MRYLPSLAWMTFFIGGVFAGPLGSDAFGAVSLPHCIQDIQKILGKARPIEIGSLLTDHRGRVKAGQYKMQDPQKVEFAGTQGRDVYNPTAPFSARFKGRPLEVMLGRTEEPHLETGTESIFYVKTGKTWEPLPGAPKFQLQDPFFARIGSELVVGGVEVFEKPEGGLGYRTVFYRDQGRGIEHLTRFAEGPYGMKDIRLTSLQDGKILLVTRPQGEVGGKGKIGVTVINRLEDLTVQRITAAPLLEGQFAEGEWGGANALYPLKDGRVGVLAHIAQFDPAGDRGYFPGAFIYDPEKKTFSPMKILIERSDLPAGLEGKSKRPDLRNVLFSGGLQRHPDGTATLYIGAGDAEVYRVTLPDPFLGL